MYKRPYIGVTGFINPAQVTAALDDFPETAHLLMVGVLASRKSLIGDPMKPHWAAKTPPANQIADLMPESSRTLNLAHLSLSHEDQSYLVESARSLIQIGGPRLQGLQINATWPPHYLIRQILGGAKRAEPSRKLEIVLQIGSSALDQCGRKPGTIAAKLVEYDGCVDRILFDPSGGFGKPFDPKEAVEVLSAISEANLNLGLGVAGGLGSDSLDSLVPIIERFPSVSIDAEGRLCGSDGSLDNARVGNYLQAASQLMSMGCARSSDLVDAEAQVW